MPSSLLFPAGRHLTLIDLTAAHAKRARELGLHLTNIPAELGGGGCTALQQVLVQEQMGRVTNALDQGADVKVS